MVRPPSREPPSQLTRSVQVEARRHDAAGTGPKPRARAPTRFLQPETVNSHAGRRMVREPSPNIRAEVHTENLSGGPAYIPGRRAKRRKACCAEMMTQRPSRAGDEGNLGGGLTRPKRRRSSRRHLRSQRRSTGLLELPDWESWNLNASPRLVCCSQLLPFERRKVAVPVRAPVPVVVVGATVCELVHAARARVTTTARGRATSPCHAPTKLRRHGSAYTGPTYYTQKFQKLAVTMRPTRTVTPLEPHQPSRGTTQERLRTVLGT